MSELFFSGGGARSAALAILAGILDQRRPYGDVVAAPLLAAQLAALDERDRRFAFALARTALRRLGQIDDLLARWLERPLPARAGRAQHILRLALADLVFLGTEPYAAVHSAVAMALADPKARHFKSLVNAVLRRAATEANALIEQQDIAAVLFPPWLAEGWMRAYGREEAEKIILAHLGEPPLDITLKPGLDPELWARRLGADRLPTGSLRIGRAGAPAALPGYDEGSWWVQDAAAALPARLFGEMRGKTVFDLCAAPGGKTLWLAASGAAVVALDKDEARLKRLKENLARAGLTAETALGDVRDFAPPVPADGVLLDAPCSSTGTIRRHPDLPWIKEPGDIRALALLQSELLNRAADLTRVGGTLIYSVCSLEPEEGPEIVEAFLARDARFARAPIGADEIPGIDSFLTRGGELRTLPCQWAQRGGIDGFYAARLVRRA